MVEDAGTESLRQQIIELISGKKGHIAGLDEVLALIDSDRARAKRVLDEIAAGGEISVAGEDVILNSDRYLPQVKCLICDRPIKRDELVPFFRERHFPFVNWGFHKSCLEGGALEEMLASGMFREEDGKIFPANEYGEGKNPVTIAIKYLRSEDFLYALEMKSEEKDEK